jgi:hypothetical protein
VPEVFRVPVTVGEIIFDDELIMTLVLRLVALGGASGVTGLLGSESVLPAIFVAVTVKVYAR